VKKILVVDDDSDLRVFMSQTLDSMGYKPILAANGNEAAEQAISEKPDLILLDVELPDTDGPQIAKSLRNHPVTKDIPIIAVSAEFGSSVRQSCLSAGCNDFIAKPFTYELLEEKLREFLLREA
jgi:CheY-like chemotaxis protein